MPTPAASPSWRRRPRIVPQWGVALIVGVLTLIIGVAVRDQQPLVNITIRNPTRYQIEVLASTPTDSTLSPLTILAPGETRQLHEVIDLGPVWILQFRSGGADLPPFQVNRTELLPGVYTIPEAVSPQLAAQGIKPTSPP